MILRTLLAACVASAAWAATTVSIEDGKAVVEGALCSGLSVRVKGAGAPLLGDCVPQGSKAVFAPRFPFRPGIAYEAVIGGSALPFEIPKPPAERTRVAAVYPSADRIPDNQLKFYVQFSAPMSKGEVYNRVRFVNQRGEKEEFAILELDQELWNRELTRVTLLFDPGRVKRGVKPNRDDGVPLRVGESYTFVVDAAWPDGNGTPLVAEYRKQFTVVTSDRTPIDTTKWTINLPHAGTREPLRILFGESLDRAMLDSAIRIGGIDGKVTIVGNETQWMFTPESPWRPARYEIEVDTMLEDLAGNKVGREFDIDNKEVRERQLERVWKKLPVMIR